MFSFLSEEHLLVMCFYTVFIEIYFDCVVHNVDYIMYIAVYLLFQITKRYNYILWAFTVFLWILFKEVFMLYFY